MELRILIAAALLLPAGTWADAAYKWVDEHGVTHYSATPPAGSRPVERLPLSAADPSPAAPVDTRAILETARALEQARLERERQREQQWAWQDAERRRAEQAAAAAWQQESRPAVVLHHPIFPQRPWHPGRDVHRPHRKPSWQAPPPLPPRHAAEHRRTHDAPLHGQRRADRHPAFEPPWEDIRPPTHRRPHRRSGEREPPTERRGR